MPWFVDITIAGRNTPSRMGGWATEEIANAKRADYETQNPSDTVSAPFEAANGDVPVQIASVADVQGQEEKVWTDGTTGEK